MPFEAAKAVAATFCWNIRYALTPVFGTDFPDQCIQPGSDRFGEMVIDCNVTRRCTEDARAYRAMETRASPGAAQLLRSPLTPDSPDFQRHVKQLRPKALKIGCTNSGYSTDAGTDDNYATGSSTPHTPYRNTWTPANTPRSIVQYDTRLPSPHEILAGIAAEAQKGGVCMTASSSPTSSPPLSPKSRRVYRVDEGYDADSSAESSAGRDVRAPPLRRKRPASPDASDENAAYRLMSLRMKSLNREVRGKKRRASN